VGSLSGALASKRVTEAFIKVGLGRMEIGLDAQRHKPALLQDRQVAQSRKRNLVNRPQYHCKAMEARNSKHEIRNNIKIQMTKIQNLIVFRHLNFEHLNLFRI